MAGQYGYGTGPSTSFVPPSGSFIANPSAYNAPLGTGYAAPPMNYSYGQSSLGTGYAAPPMNYSYGQSYMSGAPAYAGSYMPTAGSFVASAPRTNSFTYSLPQTGVPTTGSFSVDMPRAGSFAPYGAATPAQGFAYDSQYSGLGAAYNGASFAQPMGGAGCGMMPPLSTGSFMSTPQFKFYPDKQGSRETPMGVGPPDRGYNSSLGGGYQPPGQSAAAVERTVAKAEVAVAKKNIRKADSKKKKKGWGLGCC